MKKYTLSYRFGFSLLEMLIVLAILGILMSGLYAGLGFGLKSWNIVLNSTNTIVNLKLERDFIREKIENLVPKNSADGQAFFRGTEKEMTFFSSPPDSLGSGLAKYHFIVVKNGNENEALSIYVVNDLLNDADFEGQPSYLLEGGEKITFSYYGSPDGQTKPDWHDTWLGTRFGPTLVRLTAAFPSIKNQYWTDFIVRPRIAQDASCRYDVGLSACVGR